MPETVLVVEDEPTLLETLAYSLKAAGYAVETATDGRTALQTALRIKPDLIVLDVMLPEMDGFEVARAVRRDLSSAIIMLTARGDEIDRVVGLEVGADDYLTKPFSMRELLARVKAMLRRTHLLREEASQRAETAHHTLAFGDLVIDVTRREITLADVPLALKPKEYELLLFLAEHRGRMLSREFILERVWGWDFVGDSRTVDVHIRWLRQRIEPNPSEPARIVTVRGGGYRFEG
jgi:DNA-binding response OmpR family regulator